MRTLLLFLLMPPLSSSARAQAPPHVDPSATSQAVAATVPAHTSRGVRLVRDTLIGAGAGALTGYLLWAASRDCGTCGPGPQHAIVTTGLFGATVGAWIGVVQGWGVGHHPDIQITRHVAVGSTVSPKRLGGAVTIAF